MSVDLSRTTPDPAPNITDLILKYVGYYEYSIDGNKQTGLTVTLTPANAPAKSRDSGTVTYANFTEYDVTATGTWDTITPFGIGSSGILMGRGRLEDNIYHTSFAGLVSIPVAYPTKAKVYYADGTIRFFRDNGNPAEKIDETIKCRFDYWRDPDDPTAVRWFVECGVKSVDVPGIPVNSGGGDGGELPGD